MIGQCNYGAQAYLATRTPDKQPFFHRMKTKNMTSLNNDAKEIICNLQYPV